VIVRPEDHVEAIQVLSEAFNRDPVWSWVFPDPDHRQAYWRLLVNGGARYPWTFRSPGFEAVSVWVPPEGGEFLPADEVNLPAIVRSWVGAGAERVLEVFRRFDSGHPREQRHYYLGLLATRDSERGHGHGMALLSENLAQIDREHAPAYLESTNPMNVRKYQALGFEPFDQFQVLDDGPWVDRMWRPSR
jgi:GNAT superfamily N-acetyltransferase